MLSFRIPQLIYCLFIVIYTSTGEDEQDTKQSSLSSTTNLRASTKSNSTALVAAASNAAVSAVAAASNAAVSASRGVIDQLQSNDEQDAADLLQQAGEILRIVGEYNDFDIVEFVHYALEHGIGIRGYLRGSRFQYRQQLRRLARDFHHRLIQHPQYGGDIRDDVIRDTTHRIRTSDYYEEYHILSEYLIRILQEVEPGDIIPISMLLCPHPNKSLHCGGWGCHGKSCPTIRNLIKFAESLPQSRIRFGNAGQPIDNMMVVNIREKCSGSGCMNYGDIVDTVSPTTKPTCCGATQEEGRATASLLNWFATAAMFLGASGIIIFNHGGYSLKKHFFPHLDQDIITTSPDGVHISLYSRRFKLPWPSRWIQGNRITGIVDRHCKDWSAFLTKHSMPRTKSILQSLNDRLPFVNSDFINTSHPDYNAGALRSARRFVRRSVQRWNDLVNRFGVDGAHAELHRIRSEATRRALATAADRQGISVSELLSRRSTLGHRNLEERVGREEADRIRSDRSRRGVETAADRQGISVFELQSRRSTLGHRNLEERVGREEADRIRSDRSRRGAETAANAHGISVSELQSRRRTLGDRNLEERVGREEADLIRSDRSRRGAETAAARRGTSVTDEARRRATLGDRRLEERVGEEVAQQIRSDRVGRGFETAAARRGTSVSDEISRRRTLGIQNAAARLGITVSELQQLKTLNTAIKKLLKQANPWKFMIYSCRGIGCGYQLMWALMEGKVVLLRCPKCGHCTNTQGNGRPYGGSNKRTPDRESNQYWERIRIVPNPSDEHDRLVQQYRAGTLRANASNETLEEEEEEEEEE